MGQSVTLNPALKVLLPAFRKRCAVIGKMQAGQGRGLITAQLVNGLREAVLAPLEAPKKAELAEELTLLGSLSIVIDLVTQGWRVASTRPSVVLEFEECASPEEEKERIRQAHIVERDAQMREPSVVEFVRGMEKRRLRCGKYGRVLPCWDCRRTYC